METRQLARENSSDVATKQARRIPGLRLLNGKRYGIIEGREQSCHCKGVGLPFYIRWEVVRMMFDFKDLMAFGMFLIALLTFIFDNRK